MKHHIDIGKRPQALKRNRRHEVAYMWLVCYKWLKSGIISHLRRAFFSEIAFGPKWFKLKPARFYQHESAESHKRSVA
jgi:hypothetical protein